MKKRPRLPFYVGIAFICFFALFGACENLAAPIPVTEVTIAPKDPSIAEGFEDETVTLEVTVNPRDEFVVTAPAGFDQYLWYVDNDFMGKTTSPTATYPLAYVAPGRHSITVIVKEGGCHFSKTLTYRVGY